MSGRDRLEAFFESIALFQSSKQICSAFSINSKEPVYPQYEKQYQKR